MTADVESLGAQIQSNESVFSSLFDAQFAYVWTSLRRLGVDERDLDDVTHEVFLQVYKKWGTFDARRHPRPWLFAFATRAASDYRRQARHRRETLGEGMETVPCEDRVVDEAMDRADDAALVDEALDSVDLDKRAILIAFEMDECPMKEIAAAHKIPLQTAYSRLRAGRDEFAAAVRRIQLRRGAR